MTAPETPLAVTRGWAWKHRNGTLLVSSMRRDRDDVARQYWLSPKCGQTIVPVEIRELPAEPAEKEQD